MPDPASLTGVYPVKLIQSKVEILSQAWSEVCARFGTWKTKAFANASEQPNFRSTSRPAIASHFRTDTVI